MSGIRSASSRAMIRRLADAVIRAVGRAARLSDCRHDAARCPDQRRVRLRRRLTACSSSFRTSPAGNAGRRPRRWRQGRIPDGDAETLDVLAALEKFAGIRPDPEAFVELLEPLQPRLYSISSSLKTNPGRVSLTVDAVRYAIDGRNRLGVASTFLGRAHRCRRIRSVSMCRNPHNFALPADPLVADHHDRPRHRHRAISRLPA